MRKLLFSAFAAVPVIFMFGLQIALADRPITEEWTETYFDSPVAECADYGFDILADATFTFKQTLFFDKNGDLARVRVHWVVNDAAYKNSTDLTKMLDLAPGWGANQWIDAKTGEFVQTGAYTKVTAPGWGVLALGVGRLVVGGDGTITFLAGKANFIEGDLAKLCAYLY